MFLNLSVSNLTRNIIIGIGLQFDLLRRAGDNIIIIFQIDNMEAERYLWESGARKHIRTIQTELKDGN